MDERTVRDREAAELAAFLDDCSRQPLAEPEVPLSQCTPGGPDWLRWQEYLARKPGWTQM